MTQITVVGNLTRDPEMTFTKGGLAMCKFGIAVNRGKDDEKETDFYNVTTWEAQAEEVAEKVTKGQRVIVFGQYKSRTWVNDDGEKRTAWDINAYDVGLSLRWPPRDKGTSRGKAPSYGPGEEPF